MQSRDERRASYDRETGRKSLIHSTRWRKLRKLFLDAQPLCVDCGRAAGVVDHREPHHNDPALAFDWNNLQSMCKPCHDRKTATRDWGFGRAPVRR